MQLENPPAGLLKIEDFYERASKGKRLANYLIDIIVMYLVLFMLLLIVAITTPDTVERLFDENTDTTLALRLATLVIYALYMSIIEAVFKGKSIGKYITKTRVVNLDGSPINVYAAFGRGFFRALPFSSFSALGETCNPWQDRWTKTKVINELL